MATDTAIEWHSATPMPSYATRTKWSDWEGRQQRREARVAARREKRTRKGDAKKQRKLNAQLLRRMTRNPEKYTKNAARNQSRAIEAERKKIREAAMEQVRQLAAEHDPTGEMFNIGPVIKTADGKIRSEDAAKRWEAKQAKKNGEQVEQAPRENGEHEERTPKPLVNGVNAERAAANGFETQIKQEPKQHGLLTRPKPHIPENLKVPGDENFVELWDLTDAQIQARLQRAKKKKAAGRKALRHAQQAGKAERRIARDEKRKTYKDLKETWKVIKAAEKKHKTAIKTVEDREGKVIAVKIANHDRKRAMEICHALGCTIDNTPGTDEIQPRLLGMKGQKVDFNDLEFGEGYIDIRLKSQKEKPLVKSNRVDLSSISQQAQFIGHGEDVDDTGNDFIQLDVGEGREYQSLNLNHRLRKKIRRAVDRVQLQKELLVRSRVKFLLKEMGVEPPSELSTYAQPKHVRGHRILESGMLESDKKSRIRQRVELAEFNNNARILRKQAKAIAMERGIRRYLEATNRIPVNKEHWNGWNHGVGWKEPDVEDPRNIVRPEDLATAKEDARQAQAEMDDDMYSWDGGDDMMDS